MHAEQFEVGKVISVKVERSLGFEDGELCTGVASELMEEEGSSTYVLL